MHTHDGNHDASIKCDFCDLDFYQLGDLNKHINKTVHKKPEQKMVKIIFGNEMKNKEEYLQNHINSKPLKNIHEGQNVYKCQICDNLFNEEVNLISHNMIYHEDHEPLKSIHLGQNVYNETEQKNETEKQFESMEVSENKYESEDSIEVPGDKSYEFEYSDLKDPLLGQWKEICNKDISDTKSL